MDLLNEAVEMSRRVGEDDTLVVWGGGNTSVKTREPDLHGVDEDVLRVKESGCDLKTIQSSDFVPLRMAALLRLRERRAMDDAEMVAALARSITDPQAPRPSIETLLHAWVPGRFVVHTHADAVLMLTNQSSARQALRRAYGGDAVWVGYRRPGFPLCREVAEAVENHPGARAVVLERHGLVTWGETGREALDSTREMVERALDDVRQHGSPKPPFGGPRTSPHPAALRRRLYIQLAPILRGALSRRRQVVLRFDGSPDVLEFVNSRRGKELSQRGPATPDHILNTKVLPLFIDDGWSPGSFSRQIERALDDYEEVVRQRFKRYPGGEKLLEPVPRVILLPQLGMVTAGLDAKRARAIGEIYHHSISVIKGATSLGEYRTLSPREAHDIEYWPLELYKLTLARPGGEVEGRIALVTGAASGIGRAVALRLAAEGAHVAVADVDRKGAEETASEIKDRAVAVEMDVTTEGSVRKGFETCVNAFGGLDIVVPNAGIALASPVESTTLAAWERSFAVNSTGAFLTAREGFALLKRQGMGGSIVFIASKNVPAPGKDFGAYSASKAAGAQLARVLALEAAPSGIRVNMVHPDAVFRGSRLWNERVKQERARTHGVPVARLGEFYRQRSLLGVEVTPEDVAEAVLWLASDRSAKTTGCAISVDGGVKEAFLR